MHNHAQSHVHLRELTRAKACFFEEVILQFAPDEIRKHQGLDRFENHTDGVEEIGVTRVEVDPDVVEDGQ